MVASTLVCSTHKSPVTTHNGGTPIRTDWSAPVSLLAVSF